jgi:hypothetical protein
VNRTIKLLFSQKLIKQLRTFFEKNILMSSLMQQHYELHRLINRKGRKGGAKKTKDL